MTQPPCSGIRCYRFGPYVLDAHRSQLWRGDVVVPLAQKTVEVLTALIEHSDISKADLMKAVWPASVVEENNLARHISMLRKALQERPDQHEYILTIPGQGYRFVAEVEKVGKVPPPPVGNTWVQDESKLEPSPAVPSRPGWPRLGPVALSVTALAIAGVLVIAWLVTRVTPLHRPEAPLRVVRALTFGRGLEQQPSWSPDGRSLVFASDAGGNSDLWVVAVANPSPTRLTSSEADEWQPAWSPDGAWIAFRSEQDGGGLFVMPATGGSPRRIASFGFRPKWSPSGTMILFSGPSPNPTLYLVGLDGTPPRALQHAALRDLSARAVAWLPDGERVAVSGFSADRQWHLLTLSVRGGRAVISKVAPEVEARITENRIDIDGIVWSPSADQLYFSGRSQDVSNLWRVNVDPATLELTAGPERLTTGAGSDLDPALSPDGARLAFTVGRTLTRIWSVPFDSATGHLTGAAVPLTPGEPGEYDAAVPPDGTRLVYRTARGSRQEVWERSVGNGVDRLLLASQEWTPTSPRWSRDGTRLAYTRIGGNFGRVDGAVMILSPASGAELTVPTPGFVEVVPDDWSADGRWILASCQPRKGVNRQTCLLSTASRTPDVRVIASDPKRDLIFQRFSPDGRWISFIAQDPKDFSASTVYAMPASGGPWTAVTSGTSFEHNSRWAPDGKTIYFVSNRHGSRNVWGRRFDLAQGVATGEPFKVTDFGGPTRLLASNRDGNFEISVATDRLFLPVTETAGEIWLLERLDPR